MTEYIKRDDAIDKIIEYVGEDEADYLEVVLHLVPSVDVVERKHGKWTLFENDIEQNAYECSACNDVFVLLDGTPQENLYNFCPNCGADMREAEGEDG